MSFHGGLHSPAPADGRNIRARILALHGAVDPFVSTANLTEFEEEMRSHKIDRPLGKYVGAVHSFSDTTADNDNRKGAT
ncbi:MAG: hypothetical protein RJB13_631 [Pseudomonadota bacterium]